MDLESTWLEADVLQRHAQGIDLAFVRRHLCQCSVIPFGLAQEQGLPECESAASANHAQGDVGLIGGSG